MAEGAGFEERREVEATPQPEERVHPPLEVRRQAERRAVEGPSPSEQVPAREVRAAPAETGRRATEVAASVKAPQARREADTAAEPPGEAKPQAARRPLEAPAPVESVQRAPLGPEAPGERATRIQPESEAPEGAPIQEMDDLQVSRLAADARPEGRAAAAIEEPRGSEIGALAPEAPAEPAPGRPDSAPVATPPSPEAVEEAPTYQGVDQAHVRRALPEPGVGTEAQRVAVPPSQPTQAGPAPSELVPSGAAPRAGVRRQPDSPGPGVPPVQAPTEAPVGVARPVTPEPSEPVRPEGVKAPGEPIPQIAESLSGVVQQSPEAAGAPGPEPDYTAREIAYEESGIDVETPSALPQAPGRVEVSPPDVRREILSRLPSAT